MAIGQAPNLDFLKPEDGVELSPRGLIAVNPQTLMTSANGIFAGGDCVFGPRLIIDSVGDGKRAAVGIDEYLRKNKHPEPIIEVEILKRHSMPQEFMDLVRQPIPMLPLDRRTGMTEVEVGYDAASAIAEAQRCLHCWVNTVFEGTPKTAPCASCAAVASMFARKNVWNWFRSIASSSNPRPCSTSATTRNCLAWSSTRWRPTNWA